MSNGSRMRPLREPAAGTPRRLLMSLGLGLGVFGAATAGLSASAATVARFSSPVVAIPTAPGSTTSGGYSTGGEPRLIVTSRGAVVVAAQMSQLDCVTGNPTPGKGHQCVWQSTDGGRTFHFSKGEANQRGDDVDLAESGPAILESTMTNLDFGTGVGGTTVARTLDGGKTWTEASAINKSVLNDRPFMLATPDGGVVITYDSLPGGMFLVHSSDHGATWGLPQPLHVGADDAAVALNGAPAVDRKRGQLLVPFGVASSPTCTSGAAGCLDTFLLARSDYQGGHATTEPVARFPQGTGSTALVSAAADATGRDYVALGTAQGADLTHLPATASHIRLLTQTSPGAPWTQKQVDPAGGSAMMPNLVAGAAGRVAIAYYWSPSPRATTDIAPWYVAVADSTNGGRTFTTTILSKVVWQGSVQNHAQVLWDLFGVALDTTSRLHVAWTQVTKTTAGGPLTAIYYAHQTTATPLAQEHSRKPSPSSTSLAEALPSTGLHGVWPIAALVLLGLALVASRHRASTR